MYIAESGHPMIRHDLTNRLWVPFGVVLAAIWGRGLYWIFHEIRRGSYDFLAPSHRYQTWITENIQPHYLWIGLISFVLIGYSPHIGQAYENREFIKNIMITRQNVIFDNDQVKLAFKNTESKDILIYEDDFIRHYFLSHGGLWRRALYSPLESLPDNFYINPEAKIFKIGWNPFLFVQNFKMVKAVNYPVIISGGSTFTLNLTPSFQPEYLRILPIQGKKEFGSCKIRIIRKSATGVAEEQDRQICGNNWQAIPLPPVKGGRIQIINLDPSSPLFIGGLNFHTPLNQGFLWPWEGVDQVTLFDNQLNIRRSATLPREEHLKGKTYELEVVQDSGSTVLWRLWPKDRTATGISEK
jgi:hypothetical protein